jgi:hypothetical protein
VSFPFSGNVLLADPESGQSLPVDADVVAQQYREEIKAYREGLKNACAEARIDYVPLDTGMAYDKALMEYLLKRRDRG